MPGDGSDPLRRVTERIRAMGSVERDIGAATQSEGALDELMSALDHLERRFEGEKQELFQQAKRRMADLEELHHANRLVTVGTLTAGMAHELGTPLGVVLARAQMIAANDVDLAEARKDAHEIILQVRRMTQMCREVLDYARPKTPTKTGLDVVLVVRQAIDLLLPDARKRNARLVLETALPYAYALADAAKLMQILTNLIINAAQAMPRGGTVTISIEEQQVTPPESVPEPEGRYVCLQVKDSGTGIRSADLVHVFDTFFTTKKAGEGTGLGLAVSYRIAREHAGWISVATEEGEGSCFTVYLPTLAHSEQLAAQAASPS